MGDGDVALLTAGPLLDVPDLARAGRLGVASQRLGVGGHGHADGEQDYTGGHEPRDHHDGYVSPDVSRISTCRGTARGAPTVPYCVDGYGRTNCRMWPSVTSQPFLRSSAFSWS